MFDQEITSLEALGIAIRRETDAQEVYKDLADVCGNELLKERFLNLYKEEKRHQVLLENKYKEMFPDVALVLPPSQLPKDAGSSPLRKKMEMRDILQLAINEERRSREFYLDCLRTVSDLSGQRMFRFLADMEFSHQMFLTTELEMLEKYPQYFGDIKSWDVEHRLKAEKIKRT